MIGTPGYYSPEHISEAKVCPQTDLYCSGLILYEMICGRKAVPASTDRKAVLLAMKKIPFDRIGISDKNLNFAIVKLLKQLLQFNPSKRIQTAEHMMFSCYEILKAYEIRYARHAIKKFLIDRGLVKGAFNGYEQNIYHGFVGQQPQSTQNTRKASVFDGTSES